MRVDGSVLVVGAGIGGLALARALSLRGVECVVVEKRPSTNTLGMGLNLPGNAVRALTHLGVVDEAVAHGVPINRREYRNGKGRLLFATDDLGFWRGVGTPLCIRHGYLLEALRTPPTAAVRHDVRAVSALANDGQVEVRMVGMPTTTFDFVVGADGVHSAMRSALIGHDTAARGSAMTSSSWRFVVRNPGVDCWTVWSGAEATFLLIPVGNGEVYGYAASTRGGTTGTEPNWLSIAFAGFAEPVTTVIATLLSGAGQLHRSLVEEVRIPTWHRGRMVLIGDAAHATGPVWAQGAAMAMEDALVLADVLARQEDWSTVGEMFERLRRARVDHVQATTDKMSRLARLPTWLRDAGAWLLGPRAYREAYETLRFDPL